jgi:hypothetical protein
MDIGGQVEWLLERVGDLWLGALIGSFFVMVCESARPKPVEGESRAAPQGLALLIMIMSLLTPLLLLVHAFASGGAPPAVIVVVVGAVIAAAIVGALIGGLAPDVGRTLNRAAPVLAAPVFALTVYVTWASVLMLVNFVVGMIVR